MIIPDKDSLIGCCKHLPLSIDLNNIRDEIAAIPAQAWENARVRKGGGESSHSLFIKGHPPIQMKGFEDQPILAQLPATRSLIYEQLLGEPKTCLIAKLKPQGFISAHKDLISQPLVTNPEYEAYFERHIRLHIVISTNPNAWLTCCGEWFRLAEGEVWALNNRQSHGVMNLDDVSTRTHIIVDLTMKHALQNLLENSPATNGIIDTQLDKEFDQLTGATQKMGAHISSTKV